MTLILALELRLAFFAAEEELHTAQLFLATEDTDKTRLAVGLAEFNLQLARQDYFDCALSAEPDAPTERQYGAALIRQSGVFKPVR